MKISFEKILAFMSGEVLAFSSAAISGVFEFGMIGIKTFFIAALGGLGGMFGKWLWDKMTKK